MRRSHRSAVQVRVSSVTGIIARAHRDTGRGDIRLEQVRRVVGAGAPAAKAGQLIIDVVGADGKRSAVNRWRITHGCTASYSAVSRRGDDKDSRGFCVVDDRFKLGARRAAFTR